MVTAKVGEAASLWVDMRNDSNVAWRSYVADRPQLLFKDAAGSPLQHSSWPSPTVAAELATPNVPPGGTGRFVLTLTAPANAVDTVGHFAVTWGGTALAGTDFAVTMRTTGLPYEGVITNSNIPATVFAGGSRFITLFYQNLGVNSWNPKDVRLAITSAAGTPNVFRTSSWPLSARFPLTETVVTNAITKVSVPIQIPKTLGIRTWSVWLVRADGTEIPGSRQRYTTRIDSTSQFQLQSETVPIALRVGWRKRVTVKLKNSGITTWGSDTVLEVREKGKASTFVDPSWPSVLGRIRLTETRVARGGTGTFTFYLKTPRSLGVHRLEFSLVSRTVPTRIYQGSVILPVRVDP
jgi:hypothetical protein